ncbi:hypothetical protein [Acinetobacter radioresistens]|uniref:hypothetical protein n=1 Tax=Acinetobacter radioresistens TaxID=40216 RepID=UPI0032132A6B
MTKIDAFLEGVLSVVSILPASTAVYHANVVKPEPYENRPVERIHNTDAWEMVSEQMKRQYTLTVANIEYMDIPCEEKRKLLSYGT